MKHVSVVVISDRDYRIHRQPRWWRRLVRPRYACDLGGEPVTEFVALADACAVAGVEVRPEADLAAVADGTRAVLKFGPSDPLADRRFLAAHDTHSEWNLAAVEKPAEFPRYLELGRQTWSLFLGAEEHRCQLQALFAAHGPLFVKTTQKGYARVFRTCAELLALLGKPEALCEESMDVLVSEVLEFRQIAAAGVMGGQRRNDEWRHYVYGCRRVATTHAFFCDLRQTDAAGQEANVAKAEAVIAHLRGTDFATSYALDTATLAEGSIAVVETNNLFASGIYSTEAVRALAAAIAAGPA